MGNSLVREIAWAGESLPDPSLTPDSAIIFSRYILKLQERFYGFYTYTLVAARASKYLEEETFYWKYMSRLFSYLLLTLDPLAGKFPHCYIDALSDQVLGYMLILQDRYEKALEEITCSAVLPPDLLPKADLLKLAGLFETYFYPDKPFQPQVKGCEKQYNDLVRSHYEKQSSKSNMSLTFPEFSCAVRRWCKTEVNEVYRNRKIRIVGRGPSWEKLHESVFKD